MTKRLAVLGFLMLALTASVAGAQRASRPIELGIDGGITVVFDDPDNATLVNIPVQAFRVGFFISDRVSIEPRLTLNSFSSGGASLRTYVFELGALFHPGGYRTSRVYIRPFGGIEGFSTDGPADDSDGYIGAGLGVKLPFADRRLATRLEANYSHLFSDGADLNRLGILFGLSFFTR